MSASCGPRQLAHRGFAAPGQGWSARPSPQRRHLWPKRQLRSAWKRQHLVHCETAAVRFMGREGAEELKSRNSLAGVPVKKMTADRSRPPLGECYDQAARETFFFVAVAASSASMASVTGVIPSERSRREVGTRATT